MYPTRRKQREIEDKDESVEGDINAKFSVSSYKLRDADSHLLWERPARPAFTSELSGRAGTMLTP